MQRLIGQDSGILLRDDRVPRISIIFNCHPPSGRLLRGVNSPMASATTTARSEAKAMISATAAMDSQSQPLRNGHNAVPPPELEFAECDCCGLAEECTLEYIGRVRERFGGRWICGLCAEAVKDEAVRSEGGIDGEEALGRHMKFCQQFRSSSPPANPTEDLISAVKQLLRRTLDSPRKPGSACGPMMVRSKSCFSALSE